MNAFPRLGYVTGGFRDWTPGRKAEFAEELGLYSLNMDYNEVLLQMPRETDRKEFHRLLRDKNMTVGTLNAPIPVCQSERKAEMVENCRRACDVAHSVGCRMLLTMAILPKDVDIPEPELWRIMPELTREACATCAQADIVLGMEADPPAVVQNLERMERLLRLVNHRALAINFDPTNYYLAGSDPLLVIERLGASMAAGHIKDGIYKPDSHVENGLFSPKHEVPIGEGELDYQAILGTMRQKDINIPMHVEHVGWPEQVVNAVRHIRKVTAEAREK